MSNSALPRRPASLSARGARFWREVLEELELETHELALLEEACRVLDRLEELDGVIRANGVVLPDGRIMPALTEARQQGVTLARLIASLRLPDDFAAEHLDRGQRRGSARGTYKPRLVTKNA